MKPLLPAPHKFEFGGKSFPLKSGMLILLEAPDPQALVPAGRRIQETLKEQTSLQWELTASTKVPVSQVAMTIRINPDLKIPAQGYRLIIQQNGMNLDAGDDAGAFYGACTLAQWMTGLTSNELECVRIEDWPDFTVRGVMLDISRDKVPTMETLYHLIDMLAGFKVNQLQLYTEHTFEYRNHPIVWEHASPITGDEILALDRYCRERFIELVPNQNSFGHMTRWLKHELYSHLAETMQEFDVPWGTEQGPFSLCPLDPGSLELVNSLYDELLPHFSSRMLNVGCDETFDVGQGRSQQACQEQGIGRVYLEFLNKVQKSVVDRGFTMQFWGDIICRSPELIPELPKDAVALLWGYDANHPFEEQAGQFAKSGLRFYVCPGTSSWNSIAGRTDNMLENILNAAENGLKFGAEGLLNTDWGDNGHWQYLPVSYPGFAAGAAAGWNVASQRTLDLPACLDAFVFKDRTGVMGKWVCEIGNLYKAMGFEVENSSVLFWLNQFSLEQIAAYPGIVQEFFSAYLQAIETAEQPLRKHGMACQDASLIQVEFTNTLRLLNHGCKRGLLALEKDPIKIADLKHELKSDMETILAQYRNLWMARNRPGGLQDSAARSEKLLEEYKK